MIPDQRSGPVDGTIVAQLIEHAVGFYERCGFDIEQFVGPRFPETPRVRCILRG